MYKLQAGIEQAFAVFPQAPVFIQPGKAARGDPSLGHDFENLAQGRLAALLGGKLLPGHQQIFLVCTPIRLHFSTEKFATLLSSALLRMREKCLMALSNPMKVILAVPAKENVAGVQQEKQLFLEFWVLLIKYS